MSRKDGQLIERGKHKWLLRIDLGREPGTGRRRRLNRTVHGTKKQAQAVLNEMLLARDAGELMRDTKISVGAFLDQWLEASVKPRVRVATHDDYERKVDLYVRPGLGELRLAELTPLHIQDAYAELQARGLSAVTVRSAHKLLRNALQQGVKWRMLKSNPADLVDLPAIEHNEMRAMNEAEAQRFLAASRADRWHALFALMLATGLRPSEALALKWEDVDFRQGAVRIQRKLTRRSSGWSFDPPKTKRSRRVVDFPAGLAAVLEEHEERQAKLGEIDDELGLVFGGRTGQPADERNILHRHFRKVLKAAELDLKLRLYDLRHTHATLLLIAGTHPKIVSERLGHSSISITLDTYSHVLPTMQRESAAALDGMLFRESAAEGERAVN